VLVLDNRCPYCGTYLSRQNSRVWGWGGHWRNED